MSRLRVACFGLSLDGFAAGPAQDLQHPLGMRGEEIMSWMFPTRWFGRMQGRDGGETGRENELVERGFEDVGAWILGRNMFGPIRGPWPDYDWRGWWGEEPPYHVPVFVLTHHPREPLVMQGGTTFHFVTDGAQPALEQARAAAGGLDVRVGGGAATVREYLRARLLDDLHLAVSPVLLGRGEPLFAGLDLAALGYEVTGSERGERATHYFLTRRP